MAYVIEWACVLVAGAGLYLWAVHPRREAEVCGESDFEATNGLMGSRRAYFCALIASLSACAVIAAAVQTQPAPLRMKSCRAWRGKPVDQIEPPSLEVPALHSTVRNVSYSKGWLTSSKHCLDRCCMRATYVPVTDEEREILTVTSAIDLADVVYDGTSDDTAECSLQVC